MKPRLRVDRIRGLAFSEWIADLHVPLRSRYFRIELTIMRGPQL